MERSVVHQRRNFMQHDPPPNLKGTLCCRMYGRDFVCAAEQSTYGWNGIKCCLSSSSILPVMMSVTSITAGKNKKRGLKHSQGMQNIAWLWHTDNCAVKPKKTKKKTEPTLAPRQWALIKKGRLWGKSGRVFCHLHSVHKKQRKGGEHSSDFTSLVLRLKENQLKLYTH